MGTQQRGQSRSLNPKNRATAWAGFVASLSPAEPPSSRLGLNLLRAMNQVRENQLPAAIPN